MDEQLQSNSKPSSSSSSSSLGRAELGEGSRREDEEQPLSNSQDKAKPGSYPTFMGRHRMQAAISFLTNQINIMQDELNELNTVGESSIVCKEIISSIETIPDPLLPEAKGPVDVNWDRWFRGAHNTKNHKRWI
ncbi:hypothetical protein UlMin_034497 [Ulmus minor]